MLSFILKLCPRIRSVLQRSPELRTQQNNPMTQLRPLAASSSVSVNRVEGLESGGATPCATLKAASLQ